MAAGTGDSGDVTFKNRHGVDETNRKCTDCHVAHGTTASMTPQVAGNVEWPDGSPGGGGGDSRLLTADNRGVCFQCHRITVTSIQTLTGSESGALRDRGNLMSEQEKLAKKRQLLIDLSRGDHRRNLIFASLLLVLAGAAVILTGFKAYEYTESSEFCGTVCHPMSSEFARYEESPHANVECAHCHIGPGASFFIKAKIDGLKQVIAVLTDSFERPIKSPVHNLRPARRPARNVIRPPNFGTT